MRFLKEKEEYIFFKEIKESSEENVGGIIVPVNVNSNTKKGIVVDLSTGEEKLTDETIYCMSYMDIGIIVFNGVEYCITKKSNIIATEGEIK